LKRGRENCSAPEYLSGIQPVHEYLSSVTRDHEVPAMTTGEQEESVCAVVLIDDYGGSAESQMFRD
jgi:hypothetical protein